MALLKEIETNFKRLVKNETLSHSYIFYGANLAGQTAAARSLANYLESGKWEMADGILLDAQVLDGQKINLGVAVAREASQFLYQKPVASKFRTLIIISAEEFTDQAQNALLKIAEEPPPHGLILLVLSDANVLLPALRSRFQQIFFPALGSEKAKPELSEIDIEAQKLAKQFLAADRRGKSALLKSLAERDREAVEKSEKLVNTFTKFLIELLGQNPKKYSKALQEALKRQSAIKDYSTNKRLQLEAIISKLD